MNYFIILQLFINQNKLIIDFFLLLIIPTLLNVLYYFIFIRNFLKFLQQFLLICFHFLQFSFIQF